MAKGTEKTSGLTTAESMQYIGDNVDHNTCTLDAYNTFHGMGIIASVTKGVFADRCTPRQQINPKNVINLGRIPIHFHQDVKEAAALIKYVKLPSINAIDPTVSLQIFWKTSLLFKSHQPSWSGMMQLLHHGKHP